jgi:hypothetical protein
VQSADETTTLLEAAQDLGVTCEVGEPVCGAEIGRVAAVERVLVGRAARVADIAAQGEAAAVAGGIGLDVALVESASGAVLRRVHALLPAAPAAQVKALDDVARALFVDGVTSTLTVRGTPAGAEIVVDGLAAGALPAAGAAPAVVDGVLPGAHVVSVRQRGYLPLVTTSTVTAEGGAVVDAVLVVDPDAEREVVSPLQVGVAFGTAGVGALMLAAGTTIGVLASQSFFAVAEANAAIDAADPTRAGYPATVRDLHAQASSAQADWTNGGYATTVGGIVVAGVGVVAAVGGAVWGTLLLSSSENEPTSSPPSSPSPSTTRSGT